MGPRARAQVTPGITPRTGSPRQAVFPVSSGARVMPAPTPTLSPKITTNVRSNSPVRGRAVLGSIGTQPRGGARVPISGVEGIPGDKRAKALLVFPSPSSSTTTLDHLPQSVTTRSHVASPPPHPTHPSNTRPRFSNSSSSGGSSISSSAPSPLTFQNGLLPNPSPTQPFFSSNTSAGSSNYQQPKLRPPRSEDGALLPALAISEEDYARKQSISTNGSSSRGGYFAENVEAPVGQGVRKGRAYSTTSTSSIGGGRGGGLTSPGFSNPGMNGCVNESEKGKARETDDEQRHLAEKEAEAKVQRKVNNRIPPFFFIEQLTDKRNERQILDLEITNSSLAQVNMSLGIENRLLKKRLRERVSFAPAPLNSLLSHPLPSEIGPGEHFQDGIVESLEEDGEMDEEPSWEELLVEDRRFANIATSLETLIRKAKTAVAYQPLVLGIDSRVVLEQWEIEKPKEVEEEGEEEEQSDGEEEEEKELGLERSNELPD